MKKIIIGAVLVLLLAGAGGGYYVFTHRANAMQSAHDLLAKGDVRAAVIQLRNAVRDNPSNAEAHALLAQTQLVLGDPVAAEKEIKTAAGLGWNKANVAAILSQSYVAQKKWSDILSDIPQRGATPSQTAFLLISRAYAQRGLNDNRAATATIADAESLAPDNAEARVVGARFALADKDYARAMQQANEALSIEPKRADALAIKSSVLDQTGEKKDALNYLDQAVAAAPAAPGYRLERAILEIGLGLDDKARDDVDGVLVKIPDNPTAMYLRMVLDARAGNYTDANVLEQKLDRVITFFQRGLYFKALIKINLRETEQALDAATRYMARAPDDADGVRLLANVQIQAGRTDEASAVLSRAVARGLGDADTLDLLARTYVAQGKQDQADAIFQKASAAAKDSPNGLARLASSRLQVGDLSGAVNDLDRSLQLAPSQPGAAEALVLAAIRLGDLDRAQAALDKLRQQEGDTEAVGNLTGVLRIARLDRPGALQAFKETADKFPDAVVPRLNEARMLLQLNQPDDAATVLKEVLAKHPANGEALGLLVPILLNEKKVPEATAAIEAARTAAPNDLGITTGAAETYARLNDLPKAFAVLDTAKVNGKTPEQLLALLGLLQTRAGQADAAKTTFSTLIADEPTNVAARRTYVELLLHDKDYEGAREAVRAGLRALPANPILLGLLVSADLQEKGLDAALATADKLRSDPANMPAAAFLKGDLFVSQKRFADAAAAYQAEATLDPNSAPLAVRLSESLKAAGDDKKAYATLSAFSAKHPENPDVAQIMASQDLAAHRYPEATRALNTVLAQRPNDAVALNNLAWAYQATGDKRALETAQRAFSVAPNASAADTLGWILVSQGDAAKALPLLQQAVTQLPNEPSARYHLAVALKNLNRRDEAAATLRPLLDNSSQFDDKQAARQLFAELTGSKP